MHLFEQCKGQCRERPVLLGVSLIRPDVHPYGAPYKWASAAAPVINRNAEDENGLFYVWAQIHTESCILRSIRPDTARRRHTPSDARESSSILVFVRLFV